MKTILKVFTALVAVFLVLCSCSKDSPDTPAAPTATFTATQTATPDLVVFVTLRNSSSINAQRTPSPLRFYDLSMSDHSTPVTTADFSVNLTPVPNSGTSSAYGTYRLYGMAATPGVTYNVRILYKNVTLTAACAMPGNQYLNAAADQITWTFGSTASVEVFNSLSVSTYSAVMPSTPFSINTSAAYPSGGNYQVNCIISSNFTFSGSGVPYLAGYQCVADEYYMWSIVK